MISNLYFNKYFLNDLAMGVHHKNMQTVDSDKIKHKVYTYCLKVTPTKWEADDLSQDVLLKVIKALETDPLRALSNAYLYRIVLTTWTDKYKKEHRQLQYIQTLEVEAAQDERLSTRELLEVLASRLTPRTLVILILMDVFDFTAKETAEFLFSAEGAVQVAIGRARARLKKLSAVADHQPASLIVVKQKSDQSGLLDFDALVDAFRRRDPKALCRSYLGLVQQGVSIPQVKALDGKYYFHFRDPDGNLFRVTS
jgi:RNA polymerase sigma factor (sigma-70 family)